MEEPIQVALIEHLDIDDDKNTNLHYAAARNQLDNCDKLIKSGHKIDPENYLGWTPLMMATRNGHVKIINFLLDQGADGTKKNSFGSSVFLMAIASGDIDIVESMLKHLLNGGVSRQSMETNLSPFALALLFGQEKIVQYLITNNFSVNIQAPITNLTPIMYAAIKRSDKLFQLLIASGGDPFVKNANEQSGYDIMYIEKTKRQNAISQFLQSVRPPGYYNYPPNPNTPDLHKPFIPCINYSPRPPTFLNPNQPVIPPIRSSSNCATPMYMLSPNFSPIVPHMGMPPQIFFPANFNPNLIPTTHDPAGHFLHPGNNSMLNHNIFLSPAPPSPYFGCNYQTHHVYQPECHYQPESDYQPENHYQPETHYQPENH